MKTNMYKLMSITSKVLFKDYLYLFMIIANVVYDEDGQLNEEYRQNAHKAFNTIIVQMNNLRDKPFVVDKSLVVTNTARRSLNSNILGIETGTRKTTDRMISVSHRLFNTVLNSLPWQVADLNQVNANRRIELLQKLILKRLTSAGLCIVDNGKATRYGFDVATPSQQKNGGLYMAKADVMALPVVQRAMNFGCLFADFNRDVPANATEWLKANALSATPADPTEYYLRDIIVMPAVKVKRLFKRVARVNDNGTITHLAEAELEQEMFDGQMIWLKKVPSGQLRGWCFKAFGIRGDLLIELVDGWEDIVVTDIDGKQCRLGDAVGICTDSCWKAKKFFNSYEEFCDTAEDLAQYIPDFDKIWIVREAGEIDDLTGETADFGRRLSRQATQQWVDATLAELTHLTRKTRMALNKIKTYDGLQKLASESAKPLEKRSDVAGLIEALPELILTDGVLDWAKVKYEKKQLNAAANRLAVSGNYPYIAMDPWAMIQVLCLGRNPMDEDLGFLKAGTVCNFKFKDAQKLFAIRYPANFQTGTVVVNKIIEAFRGMGDVAILPYYGDLIIREDGDFDGDEMMFCPDELVIRLTEEMIAKYKPELIDFPHGRKAEMKPWKFRKVVDANGNISWEELTDSADIRSNRFDEIAETLWRSMKFNLVGVYSNMSVRCMHLGRINDCILMHVMAILCLDMVKGTAVPEGILKTAEATRQRVNRLCNGAMPWNQAFRDQLKGITGRKYMAPSNDTVDTIARLVMTTGAWSFDADGHELLDSWKLMQSGDGNSSTRKGVLPQDLADEFCEFFSRSDISAEMEPVCRAIKAGQEIGLTELLSSAFINERAMVYTCSGDDVEDKKAAYRELIREIAFKLGTGKDIPDAELRARVVNKAASIAVTGANKHLSAEQRPKYAKFVLDVFALDFLRNVEANTGVTGSDTFEARREIAAQAKDESVMEFSEEDLAI